MRIRKQNELDDKADELNLNAFKSYVGAYSLVY